MPRRHPGLTQFNSIRLVRNLFGADLLNRLLTGDPKFAGNKATAFQLPRGLTVADEVARAARIAAGSYQTLCEQGRTPEAVQAFAKTMLTEAFGYLYTECQDTGISPDLTEVAQAELPGIAEQVPVPAENAYPITATLAFKHTEPEIPFLLVPPGQDLDKVYHFPDGKRKTPFNLMQEFLDHSNRFLWAVITNGKVWRLLRDSTAVALSSYLDIDLDAVLEARDTEAFAGVYRVLHASRAAREDAHDPSTCLWEQWRKELEQGGERVREGLSGNVQQTLRVLGCGFLEHPANEPLRKDIREHKLSAADFYNELLRLVYRFIFLFVMEERRLLHEHDKTNTAGQDAYRRGYSMARLVRAALSTPKAGNRYDDLWQAVRIVFAALGRDGGEPRLALPALGGLFDPEQCPHLDAATISNKTLLVAMRLLRWSPGTMRSKLLPIDYRNMDSEELGSVYEELLELTPQVNLEEKRFFFTADLEEQGRRGRTTDGNRRKATGAYYTPPCLVELIVNSALTPLIEVRRNRAEPGRLAQELLCLRIIDPACGSGHFLLSAARHLARAVAEAMNPAEPERMLPKAMHEVVANCIYGMDINPMSIELVRMNLWLEGYLPNKPLSFLDHHLVCGNSLLGLIDLDLLMKGIPADAYKPLPGDDKAVCKQLAAANRAGLRELEQSHGMDFLPGFSLRAEDYFNGDVDAATPSGTRALKEKLRLARSSQMWDPRMFAANSYIAAFLLHKTAVDEVPTTTIALDVLKGVADMPVSMLSLTEAVHDGYKVLHWPLVFPAEMNAGGFDCVLGNPPWEKNKLQEQEWFANRYPAIAGAAGATRRRYIELLAKGQLSNYLAGKEGAPPNRADIELYQWFQAEQHLSRATSQFYTAKEARYPLTGKGDVNLYALFAETCCHLCKPDGHVGILVPSGIATDASTSEFFGSLVDNQRLMCLYDFENRAKLFPAVDSRLRFSALVSAPSDTVTASFFLTHPQQLQEAPRRLTFAAQDFRVINPNTGTIPIPRSAKDAELMLKVYAKVPVLINEVSNQNPWGIRFSTLFHMTNDSGLFLTSPTATALPLYEGKLIHHFDYRYNTFDNAGGDARERDVTAQEKQDTRYEITPRYWVEHKDVLEKLPDCCKGTPKWFIGFRDICRATDERTFIMSFLPFVGVGNTLPLMFVNQQHHAKACCLVAAGASLVVDYIMRMKLGGTHMNFIYARQASILPPESYSDEAVAYITERVVKLTYTSESMRPFAEDMGYMGDPIVYDDAERAVWRAELDAVYAKLYGLGKDELAYILDPTTFYKEKCPTVTFPTLKANEIKAYGEYRTQRLVLEAFDRVPDFTIPIP